MIVIILKRSKRQIASIVKMRILRSLAVSAAMTETTNRQYCENEGFAVIAAETVFLTLYFFNRLVVLSQMVFN